MQIFFCLHVLAIRAYLKHVLDWMMSRLTITSLVANGYDDNNSVSIRSACHFVLPISPLLFNFLPNFLCTNTTAPSAAPIARNVLTEGGNSGTTTVPLATPFLVRSGDCPCFCTALTATSTR